MYKLSPSILSSNFLELGKEIKNIENGGAHYIHIDVMDGHFVPNITLGIPIIKSIRNITNIVLDTHLMISNPKNYIEDFAKAGSDIINIHIESCKNIFEIINIIKSFNKKTAIAIKPSTDIKNILPYLEFIDMVLVMTVEPGFGGQKLKKECLYKVEQLATYLINNKINIDIQTDGGINLDNVRDVLNAGSNIVVAGSSIFNGKGVIENIKKFYNVFEQFKK